METWSELGWAVTRDDLIRSTLERLTRESAGRLAPHVAPIVVLVASMIFDVLDSEGTPPGVPTVLAAEHVRSFIGARGDHTSLCPGSNHPVTDAGLCRVCFERVPFRDVEGVRHG